MGMTKKYQLRNNILILLIVLSSFSLQGCFFSRGKKEIIPNGAYFQSVSTAITKKLIEGSKQTYKRVVIVDIVNSNGKVSILGRFITFKLFESFLKETKSPLVPRGEILDTLTTIGSNPASEYGKEPLKNLADGLKASAFVLGELGDIGVNIELTLKMVDAKTGEVISAASVPIERQDMVVSLYETY
jgi:hypothetical protein